MGFFNKVKLIFSGAEGQAEANIINALDHISQQVRLKDMQKGDSGGLFWSFAYGIASTSYSAANPYAPDSDMIDKVFPLVRKVLEDYGLSGGGGHNSEVFMIGSRYMNGVISHNKNIYMSAIDSMGLVIEQNIPEKQDSTINYIVISIFVAVTVLFMLN